MTYRALTSKAGALAGFALAAGLVLASPAWAGTWYTTPTVTNQTSGTLNLVQTGINDGDWVNKPAGSVQSAASDTYQFSAPHLDEGADGAVTYNTPGGTEMVNLSQDDVNGGFSAELASPTCAVPDPTGPSPQSVCVAGFGDQGPYDPSNSNFTPDFAFYDYGNGAPSGSTPAPVIAAGQTCSGWLSGGESGPCTSGQPALTGGFSPPDPYNYENLTFVNQGGNPVTVTVTNPYFQSLQEQYPNGCLYDHPSGQEVCLPPTTSCTIANSPVTGNAWGQTCSVQTFGGLNSNLAFDPGGLGTLLYQGAVSDQISISPGPGAPSGSAWYGVELYVQSVIGPSVQDGESFEDLLLMCASDFFQALSGGLYPYSGPPPDDESVNVSRSGVSIPRGGSLAPGRSIAHGPHRLTMRRSGNLVQDVRVNGHRFPVWSSGTTTPGARLVLQRDGNLVIRDRRGRPQWSTRTRGTGASSLSLQSGGRLLLRSRQRRILFATGGVGYPYHAGPGTHTLNRDLGLRPGDELRRGRATLVMRLDGNLALYRRGKLRWSSGTGGHGGAFAQLRRDGNLVVATPHGKVLWSSHTRDRGARLVLGPRGRLVLRSRAGKRVWGR